jgi:hypothetical protein
MDDVRVPIRTKSSHSFCGRSQHLVRILICTNSSLLTSRHSRGVCTHVLAFTSSLASTMTIDAEDVPTKKEREGGGWMGGLESLAGTL